MNVGSLFTGCGGLDLGLEAAGLRVAWACESDPHCRDVLAQRWPDRHVVPDVRDVDDQLPPVDVLAGGFPCQDVSHAGLRAGLADGTRSGLWFEFARAIRVLRPRVVVVENVPGLLTAGFGLVMADLAEAGYDASWACFRAADLGAPHNRERVFIVASDTDREPVRAGQRRPAGAQGEGAVEGPERQRLRAHDREPLGAAADTVGERSHRGREGNTGAAPAGRIDRRPLAAGSAETTADSDGLGRRKGREQSAVRDGRVRVVFGGECGDAAAADAAGRGRRRVEEREDRDGSERRRPTVGAEGDAAAADGDRDARDDHRDPVQWGVYEPAIQRWEQLTRPAPPPTDDRGRLNPRFVEWMLGFPDGWTDGVSRTQRLKMLGNAVQVQAAELVGVAARQVLKDAA